MWDGLDAVGYYFSETMARMDRARLDAAGIEATVATDNCGGMRPHFDLHQGVRLLVRAADAEAARALLRAPAGGGSPWTCPDCGEPGEPGFSACWRCGHETG